MAGVTLAGQAARELAQRTAAALAKQTLDDALSGVVGLAMEADICDEAGITQRTGQDELETIAPSDEIVVTADKLQYSLGEGPCVQAVFEGDLLDSVDIRADPRWPRWGPAAADLGVTGIISAHLYKQGNQAAALNLYSRRARDHSDQDKDLVRLIAAHASIALAHFRGAAHLWKAVDARHTIGIAQGILMHQYQISAEQAFALMRRTSQNSNTKMHDLAVEVARIGALPVSLHLSEDVHRE